MSTFFEKKALTESELKEKIRRNKRKRSISDLKLTVVHIILLFALVYSIAAGHWLFGASLLLLWSALVLGV
jgi:hypothetical protein